MTLSDAAVIIGSLLGLGIAGWQFLDHSLYRDHEEKDPIVQVWLLFICATATAICRSIAVSHVTCCISTASSALTAPSGLPTCGVLQLQALFAAVFALSVNLLQLVLFEILDVLSVGCAPLIPWLTAACAEFAAAAPLHKKRTLATRCMQSFWHSNFAGPLELVARGSNGLPTVHMPQGSMAGLARDSDWHAGAAAGAAAVLPLLPHARQYT